MTPERSEKSPPSAPNVSGVAYWNAPTKRPVETIAATEVLCVRHTIDEQHEGRERGQPDLRPARHAGSTPGGGAAAAGGDGPAVVVGISARSRFARATSQRTTSSPPTSRMIVPWMMFETPLASSGLNEPESCAPAALQRREQQRREHDADGRVAPEQRDGDAREADVDHGDVRGRRSSS